MVALVLETGSNEGSSYFYKQFCGGTLVASKYVISAAQCMFDQNDEALSTSDFQVEGIKETIINMNSRMLFSGETRGA